MAVDDGVGAADTAITATLYSDAVEFHAVASPLLTVKEHENTWLLSRVAAYASGDSAVDPDSADFLTAADSSGAVVLVAARTDVGSVWLCRVGDALAPATAAAAVDAVADVLADRPVKSVTGPLLLVTPMLAALATRNAALPPLARIMKMYLYTFDADCVPAAEAVAARIPDASLDRVAADRLHDLVPFLQGFNEAVFGQATTPTDACMERLSFLHRLGGLRVLNHGGVARCSVAVTGKVPSGVRRVGFVFTSKEHRGHGYATVASSRLGLELLRDGAPSVCLFADIDNAVSNATYARAGWKKQDVVMGLAILKTSPLDKTSE